MKRVLMVAYHFPPFTGGSGVQRTLRFAQYLPEFGWEPVVLAPHPRAYPVIAEESLADVPKGLGVRRAFALDAARHLAPRGIYPGILAVPDRWWTWWLGAVPAGLGLVREFKPEVLWSTYPIATAHLIGLTLRRLTGIRWVADFRDPMHDAVHPARKITRCANRWVEAHAIAACTRAVVTAPGTLRLFEERYPASAPGRCALVPNGYEEEDFAAARPAEARARDAGAPITLVHSGAIYPLERDPDCFFEALSALLRQGKISRERLRIVLRATGHDDHIRALVHRHGVGPLVEVAPPVARREALKEMIAADGLIVLQAANCNHQIPAKLYECFRARRPILGLTDPAGDTAAALRDAGIDTIAPLDSREAIAQALLRFLARVEERTAPIASEAALAAATRRARTAELARVLDAAAAERPLL